MVKGSWIAVTVGGDVTDHELRDMIDESYASIKPTPKKVKSKQANPKAMQILWPENLYRDVLGNKYVGLPDNAEEAVLYALSKLRPREQDLVLARCRDNKKYKAMGAERGITGSRVSQIIVRSIRKLRHPKRSRYFTHFHEALESDRFAEATTQEERREILINRHGEGIQALESLRVSDLRLSNAANNHLIINDVLTLGDLVMLTQPELLNLRNSEPEAFEEILAVCEKYGVKLLDGEEQE